MPSSSWALAATMTHFGRRHQSSHVPLAAPLQHLQRLVLPLNVGLCGCAFFGWTQVISYTQHLSSSLLKLKNNWHSSNRWALRIGLLAIRQGHGQSHVAEWPQGPWDIWKESLILKLHALLRCLVATSLGLCRTKVGLDQKHVLDDYG